MIAVCEHEIKNIPVYIYIYIYTHNLLFFHRSVHINIYTVLLWSLFIWYNILTIKIVVDFSFSFFSIKIFKKKIKEYPWVHFWEVAIFTITNFTRKVLIIWKLILENLISEITFFYFWNINLIFFKIFFFSSGTLYNQVKIDMI